MNALFLHYVSFIIVFHRTLDRIFLQNLWITQKKDWSCITTQWQGIFLKDLSNKFCTLLVIAKANGWIFENIKECALSPYGKQIFSVKSVDGRKPSSFQGSRMLRFLSFAPGLCEMGFTQNAIASYWLPISLAVENTVTNSAQGQFPFNFPCTKQENCLPVCSGNPIYVTQSPILMLHSPGDPAKVLLSFS